MNKSEKLMGMMDFIIYRAGKPPGSGLVSLTRYEALTKDMLSKAATAQKGNKNMSMPNRLTQAFPLVDSF